MQPYFFPYIGYWQLINAVDTFIIYDDVNFIKQGYINRNSILQGQSSQRITLQLIGSSSNVLIKDIKVGKNCKKLLKTIEQSYQKAPHFEMVFPLVKNILEAEEINLAKFLGNSLQNICNYLEIDTKIIYSSDIEKDNTLKGQDKILSICQNLKASKYINAIGGQELYSKEQFQKNNIELNFLQTEFTEYKQLTNDFIPYLSIIDILMFNSIDEVKVMLQRYELV